MFLEKLEIQGFKSFANKNTLVFPGILTGTKRGITAVVGPNGSGKSNVADSVRWALGEQSMKTLRGKKSEDVIFSGSDKKGKLGMAEVSLYLNNEDKQAPIDYAEVVLTRRLFRNGESEYLINSSRARLSDIQMMLARAKFGQKTYSVIGQGMVEGFLNTSLAERKEFFDEATGVKQYQIKRDDSLNKLRASHENLVQAQMLLSEIEPRLKSLTRQVNRLKKRDEIERELKEEQLKYYLRLWHEINDKFGAANREYLELEKEKFSRDKKLETLNRELSRLEAASYGESAILRLQGELNAALGRKEEITNRLARLEARAELKLEASGQFDLSFLLNRKISLNKEIKAAAEEISGLERAIAGDKENTERLAAERAKIDAQIEKLDGSLAAIGPETEDGDLTKIVAHLESALNGLRRTKDEEDIAMIRRAIEAATDELARALSVSGRRAGGQAGSAGDNIRWRDIHRRLSELAREKESCAGKINEYNLKIHAQRERLKLLAEKKKSAQAELDNAESKLKRNGERPGAEEADREQETLREKLAGAEEEIAGIKKGISAAGAEEEKKKNKLFSLQKELRELQNEINNISVRLNELKINSTRYETKLEDLEVEIRGELGGLKEIKEGVADEELDLSRTREKIGQLKRQIELIGGIDPQVETEYNETKERFDFLSGQADDLSRAIESLEKIIKELDLTIKEQFDKEFRVIAKKFEEYFKTLFNGGAARIIKVMDIAEDDADAGPAKENGNQTEAGEGKTADSADPAGAANLKRIKFLQKHNATGLAGIEIQATPPGKKIKSIAMLSGGERALTAIALICAIISANPSPFVVLDEVDAALDEANSGRLAKILDELSHKTQFIVITHNRATMRHANILYGITMGDDGISKLLSIKLEDAAKHALR